MNNDDETKPTKTVSLNDVKSAQRNTPLASEVLDEDLRDNHTVPNSKRPKDGLDATQKSRESMTLKHFASSSERDSKTGVFSRLSMKKSLTTLPRKKLEKKEVLVDFFDKQYKLGIKGKEILVTHD